MIPRLSPVFCARDGRAGPRFPGPTGSCSGCSGPRRGSGQTGAPGPWWSSRPSPCAGPSRAFSRATASFTRARRSDPRMARASRRCRRRSLALPRQAEARNGSSSPVDNAALAAIPRSTPTTSPYARCWDGVGDHGEGDMPVARAVERYPVGLRGRGYGARPAEAHPADLRYPDFAGLAAEPTECLGFKATIRKPSSRPAFRHVGRRWVPAKKFAIACAKSRSACC